jgi:hypothetical protein
MKYDEHKQFTEISICGTVKRVQKKGCNFVLMELKLLKCIYPAQWHGNKGTEQCVHVREFNKGAFRVEGQKITWAEYKAQLSERSE